MRTMKNATVAAILTAAALPGGSIAAWKKALRIDPGQEHAKKEPRILGG